MSVKLLMAMTAAFVLAVAGPARADVWDTATDSDDGNGTDNELIHGSDQIHDLGVRPGPVADQDWYRLSAKAYSSWEVVIDGTTGDIGFSFSFDRLTSGGTILQSYTSVSPGLDYSKYIAWQNSTATTSNEYLRVSTPACGTSCSSSDQYHVRSYETTITVPRYNNTSGQLTVLICQNPTGYTINGNAFLWNEASALVTSFAMNFGARDVDTFNLATVNANAANNTRGAIVITHDGRFGDLVCKSVALEAATGFSFDSPGVTKPR